MPVEKTKSIDKPKEVPGIAFVASVPPDHKIAVIPGVGIVTAGGDTPPMLNGKVITPGSREVTGRHAITMHEGGGGSLERLESSRASTPLTEDQVRAREFTKQGMRERGVFLPGDNGSARDPQAAGVGSIVMNPANPHLSLFREFKAGQITFDEMCSAMDSKICGDEKELQGFEFKAPPTPPAKLTEAQVKLREHLGENISDAEWFENLAELRLKLSAADKEIARYVKSLEGIRAENLSNLGLLEDMLKRQSNNQIFAHRLRAAISTHKAA